MTSRLLSLPAELRQDIYTQALTQAQPVRIKFLRCRLRHPDIPIGLFGVNSQIRREATSEAIPLLTFEITTQDLYSISHHPIPEYSQIRRLSIHAGVFFLPLFQSLKGRVPHLEEISIGSSEVAALAMQSWVNQRSLARDRIAALISDATDFVLWLRQQKMATRQPSTASEQKSFKVNVDAQLEVLIRFYPEVDMMENPPSAATMDFINVEAPRQMKLMLLRADSHADGS